MATWFDRDRGIRSGRIQPQVVTPADGDNVFVLGAEGLVELIDASHGDYARVSQVVDLTDYDLLTANMQTIGTIMGQYVRLASFQPEDNLVFWFDFNVGSDPSKNLRTGPGLGAFAMNMVGDIAPGVEPYSPNGTFCRNIPQGAGVAHMLGDNLPQAFPGTMNEWALQWWMNFDTSVYPASTGISPVIFKALDSSGGLQVDLVGAAALHEWNFAITHGNGGTNQTIPILDYDMDAPEGWKMFTLRYEQALSPPNQCELFINDTRVGGCATAFTTTPVIAAPSSPTDVTYGHAELVGGIDDIRLLHRTLSDLEIANNYESCTENGTPMDFAWLMQIEINDRVYATRTIRPDERRTWADFIAPVRLLSGEHDVAFVLKLEAVPVPPGP